ncbi:hypothetical protein MBLNU13_g10842t1 [Cladosporium sp. NU13]
MAHRDSRKITVASLCHANEGAITTSTGPTEQRHFHDYGTPSPPDVIPICAQGYHLQRHDTTINLPSLLPAGSSSLDGSGLTNSHHRVGRLDTADDFNGTSNVTNTTEGALLHVNETIKHLSKVDTSTVQYCNGPRKTTTSNPPASPAMPGSTNAIHTYHGAGPRVQLTAQPTPNQSPQRIPRAARPPYTEEQKFFIMYQRIIRELSWPDIKDKFVYRFDVRSGDGLTSVYYRVRKDWGMKEVLETQTGSSSDRAIVKARANRFSRDFLKMLGYFN